MFARRPPGGAEHARRVRHFSGRRCGATRARSARPFPARHSGGRRCRVRKAGRPRGGLRRSAAHRPRSAARCTRHGFSAMRLASIERDTARQHRELHRHRAQHRRAAVGACSRTSLRCQSARRCDSLSSGGAQRRRLVRLPLGCAAQTHAAGQGRWEMNAVAPASTHHIAERVAALEWARLTQDLDAYGCATIVGLLSRDECHALAELYTLEPLVRSRVVMSRHGFGRGEYQYFDYPLPGLVAALRTAFYPQLAPIANHWNAMLNDAVRYPDDHADFLARCHAAGQRRPPPLLLRYEVDDYNCLHQDIYGEHVFPLQLAVLLSEPGRDFTGGEFVIAEQRPR